MAFAQAAWGMSGAYPTTGRLPADREATGAATPASIVHRHRFRWAHAGPAPAPRRVGDFCLGVPLLPSDEQNSSLEADLGDHEDADGGGRKVAGCRSARTSYRTSA